MNFAPIEDAVTAVADGQFVLVVDDPGRENEGDLILAAEHATADKIGFMVRHTSGLICVPMTPDRLGELRLPLMVMENTDSLETAFTVSVDARSGTTTGISAADRAETIRALVSPATRPDDLARPGHVFPLRYREGGVLVRPGHTEAAVDLARMAGLYPAGVLCELVDDRGGIARGEALSAFAGRHRIPMITIEELIGHRWRTEALVVREAEARIPTEIGEFTAFGYRSLIDGSEHIALVKGEVAGKERVLVRLHSECLTGDVFRSVRCDCGVQLDRAMEAVAEAGEGVVVYDRGHEGRGIGLLKKLAAYRLQEAGRDTVDANLDLGEPVDARQYGIDAQILHDLKVGSVRLMTNNPAKMEAIERFGVDIAERVPLIAPVTPENQAYLTAKIRRMGHLLGPIEAVDEDA